MDGFYWICFLTVIKFRIFLCCRDWELTAAKIRSSEWKCSAWRWFYWSNWWSTSSWADLWHKFVKKHKIWEHVWDSYRLWLLQFFLLYAADWHPQFSKENEISSPLGFKKLSLNNMIWLTLPHNSGLSDLISRATVIFFCQCHTQPTGCFLLMTNWTKC